MATPLSLLPLIALEVIIFALICAGLICPALFVCWRVSKLFFNELTHSNFQGKAIPVIGGLSVLVAFIFLTPDLFTSKDSIAYDNHYQGVAAIVALYGFGLLGLLDDVVGNRSVGGFRGHFSVFFQQRRITTGFIKAVGGGLLAFVCAYFLAEWMLPASRFFPDHPAHDGVIAFSFSLPLYAFWIALSANTLNLLDLRPGRALFASICGLLTAAVLAGCSGLLDIGELASGLAGFALLLYLFDRSGKIMLGDCGSNALGATLAVCWICVLTRWEIGIGVVLLAAFQIWCEKHSLSRFIESKPMLRALDRKIGIR